MDLMDMLGFFAGDSQGDPGGGALSDAFSAAGGAAADGGMDMSGADGLLPLSPGDSSSQPPVFPAQAGGDASQAMGGSPAPSDLGSAYGGGPGASYAYTPLSQFAGKDSMSTVQKLMKGLGLSGDISDPKTLQSWLKLLQGGGGLLQALLQNSHKSQNALSPDQLRSSVGNSTYDNWTPQQAASAAGYFGAPTTPWQSRPMAYSAQRPSAISGASHFAEGGLVRYCQGGEMR